MGKSFTTITLGSSEHATLSYMNAIDVATKGYMYEKEKLGIVSEKSRIHKETIQNSKVNQQLKAENLNKPVYGTKPVTQAMIKSIQQMLNNAMNSQKNRMLFTKANDNTANKMEFIPFIVASSQASGNQAIKIPLSKRKNKKEINQENDNFIQKNKETNLLIFWELEKAFANQ